MSWEELNGPRAADEHKQRAEADAKELTRCLVRALGPDEQLPLRRFLQRIAYSASYTDGREFAAVAKAEGARALAVSLLKQAKVIDNE